jgi:hypothetical protein
MRGFLLFISVLILGPEWLNAGVTINLTAGQLLQADGITAVPDGSLLQVIASTTDNTFTTPSAMSFTGGSSDDIIVASFVMDSSTTGIPGDLNTAFSLTYSGNFGSGDPLLLRWWPTRTASSGEPGNGAMFGQFRSDVPRDNTEVAWFAPPDNGTYNLSFLTASQGGNQPDSAGVADMAVSPIPEPAGWVFAVASSGVAALAILHRRKKADVRARWEP